MYQFHIHSRTEHGRATVEIARNEHGPIEFGTLAEADAYRSRLMALNPMARVFIADMNPAPAYHRVLERATRRRFDAMKARTASLRGSYVRQAVGELALAERIRTGATTA